MSLRAILLGVALDKPSVVGDLGTVGGVWPERVVDSAVQWCVGEECHGQGDHALMMVTVINTMSILQTEHTHDYKKVHKVVLHHVPPGSRTNSWSEPRSHSFIVHLKALSASLFPRIALLRSPARAAMTVCCGLWRVRGSVEY